MEEEFAENVFTITDVDIEQEIRENDESHGKETEMVEETEDDGEERMYSYPNLSFKEKILRHASPSGSFASNCSRVAAGNVILMCAVFRRICHFRCSSLLTVAYYS